MNLTPFSGFCIIQRNTFLEVAIKIVSLWF
jgi:hypothetical protein